MPEILVYGSSISYGAWDKEGGWVVRLRKDIDKKTIKNIDSFYYLIYNLGVSGDTTEGLIKRFEFEAKTRIDTIKETIIIFEIGANDSLLMHGKGVLRSIPIEINKFRKNIQNLIDLAKKYSLKIVFVGLTPVDEKLVDPVPWYPIASYKNDRVKTYNDVTKHLCIKNNVYFVKIFDEFKKGNYKKLLEDGIHPNSQGHKKIYEIVKNFLIKNKIIVI